MKNFLSVFLAVFISGPLTYSIDYHLIKPYFNSKTLKPVGIVDYSPTFEEAAFGSILIIYLIYIFIGVPITLLVDLYMTRYMCSYFKKYVIQILLYFIPIIMVLFIGGYVQIDALITIAFYVYFYFHLLLLLRFILKEDT